MVVIVTIYCVPLVPFCCYLGDHTWLCSLECLLTWVLAYAFTGRHTCDAHSWFGCGARGQELLWGSPVCSCWETQCVTARGCTSAVQPYCSTRSLRWWEVGACGWLQGSNLQFHTCRAGAFCQRAIFYLSTFPDLNQ